MKHLITHYIRAGYPGIYLVSSEEARVEAQLKTIASELKQRLYAWSVTEGLVDTRDGSFKDAPDPVALMALVAELPKDSMVLLRDLHLFFLNVDPFLIRALKDALRQGKSKGRTLLLVGCRQVLPPELEREMVLVEFAFPDKRELAVVLDNIARSGELEPPTGELRELLLDSACGLTSIEAENAFALSIVERGQLCPERVARQKASEVRKSGLLEVCATAENLDSVGGLELLKQWLLQRKDAFGPRAEAYGLPTPKGLLITGIPGTGKSLIAKATAAAFQRPLLKLDAGRLFAGLVGQSESNLRSVIATTEAIAPCVLWVDEIEKGLAGGKASAVTDGGTAARLFGSLLSWMQEKTKPVFVVATANDVSQLPPELLRKGRFDEIFYVDLPTLEEREAIWRIQIAKYRRNPADFDVRQLAMQTEGLTGSEIEQAFIEGLYDAFSREEEPTDLSLTMLLNQQVPLSKMMAEQITALRQWAKGRARLASATTEDRSPRRILASN